MIKELGAGASQQIVIETPQLLIKGNIMSWKGTMIQFSNISCISTRPLAQTVFPSSSLTLLLIGFVAFIFSLLMSITHNLPLMFIGLLASISCSGLGAAMIYTWYKTNEERKKNTVLNIVMNSGNNFQFVIKNSDFLDKVLKVLEQIMIDGGVGKQNVTINIQKCNFAGDAQILNDFNLS